MSACDKDGNALVRFTQADLDEAVRLEREAILELAAQKTACFPNDSDYTRGYALAKQAFCQAIRARGKE